MSWGVPEEQEGASRPGPMRAHTIAGVYRALLMREPILRPFWILSVTRGRLNTIIHFAHVMTLRPAERLSHLPQVIVPGGAELRREPRNCGSRTQVRWFLFIACWQLLSVRSGLGSRRSTKGQSHKYALENMPRSQRKISIGYFFIHHYHVSHGPSRKETLQTGII